MSSSMCFIGVAFAFIGGFVVGGALGNMKLGVGIAISLCAVGVWLDGAATSIVDAIMSYEQDEPCTEEER